MNDWTSVTEALPGEKQMVTWIAHEIEVGAGRKYTTDPYCGWLEEGEIKRWPHPFSPTHWQPVEPPK